MARATNIYLVGPDLDGALYGFTVKHEAKSFIRRHIDGEWAKTGRVERIPDGGNSLGASPRRIYSLEEFLNG